MRQCCVLLLGSLLMAACSYGTRIADFRPAYLPNGVNVRVNTTRGDLNGELIEMRETGFVMLTSAYNKLRLIPFAQVRSARFDKVGSLLRDGKTPTSTQHDRLRLLSRFPHGMSPDVLQTLLTTYGQTDLLGVE